MMNKQIEMLTPSLRLGGNSGRPVVAVWVYQDNSLAIAYVDFQATERFILWGLANAQQFNFANPGELNHMSYHLGTRGRRSGRSGTYEAVSPAEHSLSARRSPIGA